MRTRNISPLIRVVIHYVHNQIPNIYVITQRRHQLTPKRKASCKTLQTRTFSTLHIPHWYVSQLHVYVTSITPKILTIFMWSKKLALLCWLRSYSLHQFFEYTPHGSNFCISSLNAKNTRLLGVVIGQFYYVFLRCTLRGCMYAEPYSYLIRLLLLSTCANFACNNNNSHYRLWYNSKSIRRWNITT